MVSYSPLKEAPAAAKCMHVLLQMAHVAKIAAIK